MELYPPLFRLPLQNKFFYLHYASTSIHSCGNFRCSLIRVLLAVSAAVFALRKLRTHCSNNAMELYPPLFRLPLQNKFSTYIMFAPLSTAAETSAVLSFAYLSQFPPQFSPCENCLTVRSNNAMEFYIPCSAPPYRTSFSTYIIFAPLSIAVRPVLTYSRMPNGSRSFIKLSILSSLPVASTITESTSTSTMCAR